MDIVNNADVVSGVDEPCAVPLAVAVERGTSLTPAGIKSSPPILSKRALEGSPDEDESPSGKSDSEAETILLPGPDGYSPAKIRKTIKLEDKPRERENNTKVVDKNNDVENLEVSGEGAASSLGKRKRWKHGNARSDKHESVRNGNSSGLSSVPSSPIAAVRASVSKQAESDSELSKSASPPRADNDKARSVDRDSLQGASHEQLSSDEKDRRKIRRRRSSGSEVAVGRGKQSNESQSMLHVNSNSRNATRSTSPGLQTHRRSASSNSVINGVGQKKRKVPAPLRPTRDRRSVDGNSDDDSSVGESPHPRRSRTRNLGTPPTGDSSIGFARMAPHKKRNPFGRTALADACEDGDINKARILLQEKPEDIDVADAAGNTPLQCASLNGHEDVVKLLLDAGCNIHCVNDRKDSPLLDAVENGHLEVVRLLLAAGVNPRIRNEEGEEPINKIDETGEDADAIRQALMRARANFGQIQPSAPVQSPHLESYNSRSRRTQSHGRSTKTGEHQLYTQYSVNSLRSAAAKGDLQTVGNILQVIVTPGFDDPESLVAAARGGHDEVLQILLGFLNADPDPPPLKDKNWEYATPMLAAIGSDNIKVIKLLLACVDDNRFDPTKRYNGNTYYEIARQREGPLWEEEERILREAFQKYSSGSDARQSTTNQQSTARGNHKKHLDSDGRSSGPKSRPHGTSVVHTGDKREQKSATSNSGTPVKRGPGRPRKEGNEPPLSLDREPSTSTSLKEEKGQHKRNVESTNPSHHPDVEPTKPRRKLISGKDLKGEREKQRRASIASIPSSSTAVSELLADEKHQVDSTVSRAAPRLVSSATEPTIAHEKTLDRARSIKRDDSKDRLSAIRGESPVKRPRTSLTPPSESSESGSHRASDYGTSNKRRRLEGEKKIPNRTTARWSSSPDRRTTSGQSGLSNEQVSTEVEGLVNSKSSSGKDSARNNNSHETRKSLSNPDEKMSTDSIERPTQEVVPKNEKKAKESEDSLGTKGRKEQVKIKREEGEEQTRKWEEDHQSLDRPRNDVEEVARRQQQEAKRQEEKAKRHQEEAKRHQEEAKRQQDEAKRQQDEAKRQQEENKRQQEELKRQEEEVRRKKEEEDTRRLEEERVELLRKAEERKRLFDEQVRIQREEHERRKAAQKAEQLAEQRRLQKEREAARLAKLPPLLRWFDGYPQPATRDIASEFRVIQGVRYDTIRPEATGGPDAKEQWMLNTQVALLLGEKDLQLSRYTAWERIPVSELAKKTLWKVESERYAMITTGLRYHNQAFRETSNSHNGKRVSYSMMGEMRAEAWSLFLALDLFFVKVSDFMFIVHKFQHLSNIQLQVQYRELPPDSSWLDKLTFPAKWRQDADAEANYGFAPGVKTYVNGELIHEDKPKLAQTSNTPFPEQRVPRIGFRQVFPNDPDYDKVCVEQGLEHLLPGRDRAVTNDAAVSLNGSIGVVSPELTNGESHRTPDASALGNSIASHDIPNGLNGV